MAKKKKTISGFNGQKLEIKSRRQPRKSGARGFGSEGAELKTGSRSGVVGFGENGQEYTRRAGKRAVIGFKVDYQQEYQELQRSAQGLDSDWKRAWYKDFYKRIAKAADQRMIELERLSQKEGYKEVTEWAYAKAQRDIRAMFGEDATRFNRKIPDNLNSIYKDINRVLNFLNAPTSSATGIQEIYQKRAQTISDKYNIDLDWSTTGHMFESVLWKKVGSKKGSATVLKAIGVIQESKEDVQRLLKEHKPISLNVTEDENGNKDANVQAVVNNLLRYYKKDLNTLLKNI